LVAAEVTQEAQESATDAGRTLKEGRLGWKRRRVVSELDVRPSHSVPVDDGAVQQVVDYDLGELHVVGISAPTVEIQEQLGHSGRPTTAPDVVPEPRLPLLRDAALPDGPRGA
jgi:hypothetical protein